MCQVCFGMCLAKVCRRHLFPVNVLCLSFDIHGVESFGSV